MLPQFRHQGIQSFMTVEEHGKVGGLGDIVARFMRRLEIILLKLFGLMRTRIYTQLATKKKRGSNFGRAQRFHHLAQKII